MEKEINQSQKDSKAVANCNVSSTFNYSVGIAAIVAAGLIGYLIYQFLAK